MEKKFMDLSALERKSQSLVAHIDTHGVPTIQRNIAQLDAVSRRLAKGPPDSYTEATAQMFLASTGLDIAKYTRTIRDIDLSKSYEPLEPISELDVQKFLEHQHQMLMGTAIEEGVKLTANAFRTHYIRKLEEDWEAAKRELLEPIRTSAMAQQPSASENFHAEQKAPVSRGSTSSAGGPLGHKASYYAKIVEELNAMRHSGKLYAVASAFKSAANHVEETFHRNFNSDIIDSWRLIQFVVGEESHRQAQSLPHEKQYQQLYESNALALRHSLIRAAKAYSETIFLEYLRDTIASNPVLAQHEDGGKPSLKYQVRGFVKVKLFQHQQSPSAWLHDLEDYDRQRFPIWPQIFYCFRCGNVETALEVARSGPSRVFADCLAHMVNNPEEHDEKGLPEALWKELITEYNTEVVRSKDPYKVAMYNLIGRCEPNPIIRSEYIYPSMEDYMWFKLSMLWESANPLPDWLLKTPRFKDDATRNNREFLIQGRSLAKLQEDLRSFGPSHFNANNRTPLLWFNVLVISQQYEQAIAFLVTTDYLIEAVHFAITLDYYGLLHTLPQKSDQLLVSVDSEPPAFVVNLSRIIIKYVEMTSFASTRPVTAFHYLYVLNASLPAQSQGSAAKMRSAGKREAIADVKHDDASLEGVNAESLDAMKLLLLDSKEFDSLIGVVHANRVEKTGCLYYYLPSFAHNIIVAAAEDAKINGNYVDAVRLFLLAEEFGLVATILMDRLSRLANAPISHKERQLVCALTAQLMDMRVPVDRAQLDSLALLLKIVQYFDLYHSGPGRYDDAVQVLDSLQLIPQSSDPRDLEDKVNKFKSLEQNFFGFRRNFADVAQSCMEIYYAKCVQIKQDLQRRPRDARNVAETDRDQILRILRAKARALVNFVGMIQLADVNAKLVGLEARMA